MNAFSSDSLEIENRRLVHRSFVHASAGSASRSIRELQFLEMSNGYAATGGFVDGDALAISVRGQDNNALSTLARAIANRTVVSFVWGAQRKLPLFQFELASENVVLPVVKVMNELSDVFDDWDLALWFCQPNVWLDYSTPVQLISSDSKAVHEAARADRYIVKG